MVTKTLPGALTPPSNLNIGHVDIWLEQQIWGHRLYNDQTPWLLLLEAIGVMAHRATDENSGREIFIDTPEIHENISYKMRSSKILRLILFGDRKIEELSKQQAWSDSDRWAQWFKSLSKAGGETKFGYLRGRFTTFMDFASAVMLLRGSEVEPHRKRRLTSRHLAPRGPAMLSADFGEGRGKAKVSEKDRRFFSRGGELLFLMLNRSGCAKVLDPLIKARLLSSSSRWNRLAVHLTSPELEEVLTFDNIGYLPMPKQLAYEVLGQDWLSLLSLPSLPDDHLSEPLMRLSGLAVIRYIAERSAKVLSLDRPLIPIDTMGPNTGQIRKLSRDTFASQRDKSRNAIDQVVNDFVASPEWIAATKARQPNRAVVALASERFGFEPSDPLQKTVDTLPQAIRDEALDNHNEHLGLVPGFYAEQIGLAARRGSSRWYVFSDSLLEAIVLSNVAQPMEYEAFLERLFERYGFVIGTEVFSRYYTQINTQQVQANQRHLEDRLRMLGLLKRLSDDCAFVINPFWTEEESA